MTEALQTPLLTSKEWDEEIASQVSFYPTRTVRNNSSDVHQENLYLTYFHASSILKFQNPRTNEVFDRIHVNDIIGAEIEFCLGANDGKVTASEKANKGRETMEALERDIGKQLIAGSDKDTTKNTGTGTEGLLGGATAYLNIYAYPRASPRRGIVKCCNADEQETNEDEVDPMTLGHRYEMHRRYKLKPTEDFANARALVQCIRRVANLKAQRSSLKYLVLVNPFSGTKKGAEIYETIVKKMLQEGGIDHDMLVTKHAGHAVERMMEDYTNANENENEKDVSEYDGVIAMGGDGILAEVLRGFKTRSDYDVLMGRINFGIVGCGTSNGLAASILHAAKVRNVIMSNVFCLLHVVCVNTRHLIIESSCTYQSMHRKNTVLWIQLS